MKIEDIKPIDRDMIGKTFGKLYVFAVDYNNEKPKKFIAVCECGNLTKCAKQRLNNGSKGSCGCGRSKHGMWKSAEYRIWWNIKTRCQWVEDPGYPNYGGRGIQICREWEDDFLKFYSDMGPRPSSNHTVERVDVNGHYEPSNCIWTEDRSLQSYNQRLAKNNLTGTTGVSYEPERGPNCWVAQIFKKPLRKKRGFSSYEAAVEQRRQWEIELYGFNKV
jgi:hypothetical protein